MLMHRPQTPQPGFGSITLLQKFTPLFKILDLRLIVLYCDKQRLSSQKSVQNLLRPSLNYIVGKCATPNVSASSSCKDTSKRDNSKNENRCVDKKAKRTTHIQHQL